MHLAERFFKEMLRIRMVEEAIAERYVEQQIRCPIHLSIGQEAVAVGVCQALRADDQVMSSHRSHAHYLAKGGDLPQMISELYGKATGCCNGRGGSMHLLDVKAGFMGAVPIVGSTIPIAVGLAFATHLKQRDRVVVVFFGEGATEEGVFHESTNFAALHKLPIVFACENNLYSVYSPIDVRQPTHRQVFELALGHGIKSQQVDGNDVVAVYEVAREAVHYTRSRRGPVFIEFQTYRWREHCGPNYDNDLGYRSEDEFLDWKQRDPLIAVKRRLAGFWKPERADQLRREIQSEIAQAFAQAQMAPFPHPDTLLDHVLAE